ncbi:C-glycoside deglycosidase beta subunit domain-containing protein [Streptomyces mangrovisoli]|uniref:C-deglycosylation enzyme beta subunit n=1 Tax=Streptomyces mangrovisoli TaxID=1428628 RepID=A0A1J4P276_9ACTN|nr:DUF6379 domain-containing protein [Streptomyces mangrovisoli]OIJ68306.1 hypothetical protein WN71_007710 [Streptomyces mangrovisoli]
MFENFLIRSDSLRNEVRDGKTVGFTLAVRHANYRGCYLSLHNGYYVEVDGTQYATDRQTFEINGQAPRSFDEIRTAVHEHWNYDDEAVLHVEAPGGLAPGEHTLRFQQSVLAAYGYLPTDEEWVKNPPTPGSGAGSDKTPEIVAYRLTLTEPEKN